jgi:(3R)-3-hydroxyacyl-CoA dehydrogenase / 3a,7a,12a-trihydroxy-5b-cholest-24-enoyl-CoA hydratase / enoyl-CoA hydratase 2
MSELRFDGKVVIVTGAGNGLGRAHALLFGSRGAKVVVNDLGGGIHGEGKGSAAADKVVEEIRALGGEAVANYDSVTDGENIVKTAMDAFGRVDVLINNAGILRDTSFANMSDQDWNLIYEVHVRGSYKTTKAVWEIMRSQGYGRIIMTASAAGIYGNFGQANYSMAKLGLYGFANTLALEGRKRGIHVNTIAPIAGSRLTETVLPKDVLAALDPAVVSTLVAWLCHEDCQETGGLFEVGGGYFGKLRWQRTKGVTYRVGRQITPEMVRDNFATIGSFEKGATFPSTIMDSMAPVMANVQAGRSKGGNDLVDADLAVGFEFPEARTRYDQRDLAIYALGVGAAKDPQDEHDLRLVFEMHRKGFQSLPTYGVIPALTTIMNFGRDGIQAPGLSYGIDRVLHGEQYLELRRPLPPKAELKHKARVKDVFDKGKGALVVTEVVTYDEDGEELAKNEVTTFVRGAGGFGGDRGPDANVNVPPDRAPDFTVEEKTSENQALLYRLSGDWNPLHADPSFAKAMRFEKPILHGLCTFGFAARHVLSKAAPEGNSDYFKSIKVRFADSVFPGETLVTQIWKESPTRVIFQTKAKERDSVVISNAAIELFEEIPKKIEKPKAAASAAQAKAEPIVDDIMNAIGGYVQEHPELGPKVGKIFAFEISSPDSTWVLNVKDDLGVKKGATGGDCVFQLSAKNFMDMVSGKASPQKLYFGGELKINGDVMASQKLDFLDKVDEARVRAAMEKRVGAAGGGAEAAAPSGPRVADVMRAIGLYLERNPEVTKRVQKKFRFNVGDESFLVDAKEKGTVIANGEGAVDCTFILSTENYMKMVSGEVKPQKLYFSGDLKIEGDVMASQKLDFIDKVDESLVKEAMGLAKAAPAAEKAAAPAAKREALAPKIFEALAKKLGEEGVVLNGLNVPVLFQITEPSGAWLVDLGAKRVVPGAGDAATVISMSDASLGELVKNPGNAARLYQRGKMRVDGDVAIAKQLGFLEGLA